MRSAGTIVGRAALITLLLGISLTAAARRPHRHAAPPGSANRPLVAVEPFEGPQAAKLRRAVMAMLKSHARLVAPTAAQVVIDGEVTRKGKGFAVSLTVHAVAAGGSDQTVAFVTPRAKVSGKARGRVAAQLATAVLAVMGQKQESEAATAAAKTAPVPERSPEPAPAAPTPSVTAGTGSSSAQASSQTLGASAQASPPELAAGGPALVTLDAGMGFQQRSFTAQGTDLLPSYSSSLYPSVYVSAIVHPLANTSRGVAANLGLSATLDRAVGLRSHAQDSGQTFDSDSQRIEIGGLYRAHFGSVRGPTVRGQVLYGVQSFNVGGMTALPDSNYKYLGFGADLELPLFSTVSLTGGLRYDSLFGVGGLSALGANWSGYGLLFEGGLRAGLPMHLHALALVSDLRRHVDYTGASPIGMTATQGDDEWLGGRVLVGFEY
jgi:hypothetical protein